MRNETRFDPDAELIVVNATIRGPRGSAVARLAIVKPTTMMKFSPNSNEQAAQAEPHGLDAEARISFEHLLRELRPLARAPQLRAMHSMIAAR